MIKTYQFLKDNAGYTGEEIPSLLKLIIYSIRGLLTLSFSEDDDLKQSDLEDEIESLIN